MGPSGSGKSTLLHLLSGLDKPTFGRLTYDDSDIYRLNDRELSASAKEVFLAMSAVITLLFAFAAAFPAAHFAAKVSPVAAMSGKNDADNYSSTYGVRAASHRRHPVFSGTRRSRQTSLEVHPSKRTMKKIRCFAAYYARLNLKRSRGRTAVTILSLIMNITVFVALQSFVGLINASGSAQTRHMGDYSLVNEITGFSPVDFNELQTNEAVREIAALLFFTLSAKHSGQAGWYFAGI